MNQLSEKIIKLIERYKQAEKVFKKTEGTTTIHVDEVASRVAAFYEKIRGIIDWREEHLLKKGAIERILKRHFLIGVDLLKENSNSEEIAEPLVLELIRGGHYPNDKLPQTKITDVQNILNKYIFILKNTPKAESGQEAISFYNWLLSIAACEIEETLSSSYKERILIDFMFEAMKERIVVNEGAFSINPLKEEEKNIQIYIAVHRALFKLDAAIISYHLLKYKYPNWQNLNQTELLSISREMLNNKKRIEKSLSHPLGDKFYQICEKYDTPYLLIGDILEKEKTEEIFKKSDWQNLENLIRNAYQQRLLTLKGRLFRAAFYSTLSILLTNIFSVIVLEIPLAKLITGKFTPWAIAVDILGPTFLMFLLVVTIKPPSKSNLEIVIMETMKIVYQHEKMDIYEVKAFRKKGISATLIISLIYLLSAFISFGVIVWLLNLFRFPPTSIVINSMFVALIFFAGLAIRKRGQELTMEEKSEGFWNFLFDIFSLPVAAAGRWLSIKWKKYNAIAILFATLIDLPFMVFVDFLEQWRYFLKEKKEEIH